MIRHAYGPKIAFLHIISESKQACFRPFFRQCRLYLSRFSSRGCKHTSGGSRGCKDHLWSVMFMNYAEYLRYLARVERGWRVYLISPHQHGSRKLSFTGCRVLDQVQPILPYIIYSALDHMNRHRDACTTSSGRDAAVAVYVYFGNRRKILRKVTIALRFWMAKKKLELERKRRRLTVIDV